MAIETGRLFERKLHATTQSERYGYDSAYRVVTFERGTVNGASRMYRTDRIVRVDGDGTRGKDVSPCNLRAGASS